jgi:proton-dependent oligopeptide transporter, POT family
VQSLGETETTPTASAVGSPESAPTGGLKSFFNHPAGLYPLFFTEMWERFSFYTMIALLSLYLNEYLGYTESNASNVTTWYNSLVYFTPFLGGLIADRLIGYVRAILVGGFLMMAGHLLLGFDRASDPQHICLFAALALLICGNGLFKPNISTLVGMLYGPKDPRRDQGFTIFYMGINIGAFIAPLTASRLRRFAPQVVASLTGMNVPKEAGWHIAFASAGVGMVVSLIIFAIFKNRFRHLTAAKAAGDQAAADLGDVLITSTPEGDRAVRLGQLVNMIGVVTALSWLFVGPMVPWPTAIAPVMLWPTQVEHFAYIWLAIEAITIVIFLSGGDTVSANAAKLKAVFVIVALFWMAFHQNSVTMTFFARDNTATTWSAEDFQAIEPICIVLFSPLMVVLWSWLNRKGREPSRTTKIAMGMVVTALSYLVMFGAGRAGGDTGRVGPEWLIGAYAMLTVAELWLSPIGLSLTSQLAPPKYKGLWMGFWFTATAIGNKLVHVIGQYWKIYPPSQLFLILVGTSLIAAFSLIAIMRLLKRLSPQSTDV